MVGSVLGGAWPRERQPQPRAVHRTMSQPAESAAADLWRGARVIPRVHTTRRALGNRAQGGLGGNLRALPIATVHVGQGIAAPARGHRSTVLSRILAHPCTVSAVCEQRALYKPRLLTPGSYYTLARLRWTTWKRSRASARTLLYSEFTGQRRITRTRVEFSRPRRMCGVLTFTRWHAGTGDGGHMTRSGRKCFFVPSR